MPKLIIDIKNQTKYNLREILTDIKKSSLKIYESLFDQDLELTITFLEPKDIQKINKKYRNIDQPTDVLSFKSDIPEKNSKILADIIICPEIAKSNAKKHKNTIKLEIIELTKHGMIHILGFDHESKKDQKKWETISKKTKI